MQLDGIERTVPRPDRVPLADLGLYETHGGHTLRRHVYTRPGDELRRIRAEGVAAAGRFLSRGIAQRCVNIALTRRSDDIRAWLAGPQRWSPFSFVDDIGNIIGHTLTYAEVQRGVRTPTKVSAVRLVLRRHPELPGGFTVVTAYPTHPLSRRNGRRPERGAT